LGDVLTSKYGAEVELLASEGGVFEVVADGRLIYSKKELNRFPEDGEVEGLLDQR
jgi:selenoprotein W-related protein